MAAMEPVIGLEIHAQLNTATKLFCSCPTSAGAKPNQHICEVCSGQPGALPRINARAIKLAAKAGLALNCHINEISIFARKNYFYPDLPNGYQTSQLDPPVCEGLGKGGLTVTDENGLIRFVRLNRIHMEDDAGKCVHDEQRGQTLLDLNRAGTPLIELVTEPDLRSATEVVAFLKKLHSILVHQEITLGRMEEGEFRCDVNISLRPQGTETLGVRSEIKNLNSFRHVEKAMEYEIKRQTALYENGQPVVQETRLFDPTANETRALRSKEEAHDYRYFPQPDLPPVLMNMNWLAEMRNRPMELPEDIKKRLVEQGLSEDQATLFVDRKQAIQYFNAALAVFNNPKRLATLMMELLLPACQKEDILPLEGRLKPAGLAALARMMDDDTLSKRAAYDMFSELFDQGGDPEALAKQKGVAQVSDPEALAGLARQIIEAHPDEARKYREGQEKILSFFVGQLMRQSKGAANPKLAGEVFAGLLKN